ncbi:MAG: alpha/beta hydrolase, partial [Anaerolineales bacterium]|nr:alpha/beta hydrolase [Anaerolineales bacterium]
IHVPTLILHGADDQIIPLTEIEAMHTAIPGSKLVIIPDAGHLVNLEQPDSFNRSIRNFLQEL